MKQLKLKLNLGRPEPVEPEPELAPEVERVGPVPGVEYEDAGLEELGLEAALPCPFCGEDAEDLLDVIGGSYLDWIPCCQAARDAVGLEGWEAVFGRPLEGALTDLLGREVREVVLEGDRGDSVVRCRPWVQDPGAGVKGWQEEVFVEVDRHHRHHPRPQGWKFGIAVWNGFSRVGVITVGRPVSRILAQKEPGTLEVTRCCTWGETALRRNVASQLYGAAARHARRLGFRKLITYTLAEEDGASLKAAGFTAVAKTEARREGWNRSGRARTVKAPTGAKTRWERPL